jgi:uncharacterized protein YuzE
VEINYDQNADALEILLTGTIVARTEQLDLGTLVDLDEHGTVVAIEVIRPTRPWPLADVLDRFRVDEADARVLRELWGGGQGRYPFAEQADLVPA